MLTTCFLVACLSIAAIGQPGVGLWLLFHRGLRRRSLHRRRTADDQLDGGPLLSDFRAFHGDWLGVLASAGQAAIIGPWLVGCFLSLNWSVQDIFLTAAIPALISALAMFALRWVMKPSSAEVAVVAAH